MRIGRRFWRCFGPATRGGALRAGTTAQFSRRSTTSRSTPSPGALCPRRSETGIPFGSASGASARRACLRPFSMRSLQPAAPRTWFRCSTPRLFGRMSRPQAPKGAARSGAGPLARGFSTKIHLKVDLGGLPLAFHLTEGQASDSPQFEIRLDLGPDITPRAAVGDKGYDRTGNRVAARARGICPVIPVKSPVIPVKSSAKNRPAFFPKALYRARARIEQLAGKLKRFKRIALRCEKTVQNYGSLVAFALGLIIVKSVHTA